MNFKFTVNYLNNLRLNYLNKIGRDNIEIDIGLISFKTNSYPRMQRIY